MSQDYCITGTPAYSDECQELLKQAEQELMTALDRIKDAFAHADPLTEHGLRMVQIDLMKCYTEFLSLRSARKHQYASSTQH